MPLFTHTIAVDWSAANTPKRGKDSIWLAEDGPNGQDAPLNIPTRAAAIEYLRNRTLRAVKEKQRLIIGLDFAFGYPAGIAKAVSGEEGWRAMWNYIAQYTQDAPDNKSNRYTLAAQMNRQIGLEQGPFWGHPWQHTYENLKPTKPTNLPPSFPNMRIAEQRTQSTKSVFQLAYNGAVGSQTLLGVAALHNLTTDPHIAPHIAIWPFETQLAGDFSKPITLAEIYPSSHKVDIGAHKILDAAQVLAVAKDIYYWNQTGALEDKLSAFGLSDTQRALVINEEGWILGQ